MQKSKIIALWVLSLTWGLPMTLLGMLVAIVLCELPITKVTSILGLYINISKVLQMGAYIMN